MSSPIRTVADLRHQVAAWRREGKTVGFVPTMGALHAGHLALVDQATEECDETVVSIFVNPRQFDRASDLDGYPRDERTDLDHLARAEVSVVFCPHIDEVYPDGFATTVTQSGLSDYLCGASRPGHFDGVLTVVSKLFGMVAPDRAYFGQKDFQQVAVIRRMVIDLNVPLEIRVVPTVREADGLALSSRNRLLSDDARAAASAIYAAMLEIEESFLDRHIDADHVRDEVRSRLDAIPGARVDYVEVADPETLAPRTDEVVEGDLLAVAVFFDDVRLIDNILLDAVSEAAVDDDDDHDHDHGDNDDESAS